MTAVEDPRQRAGQLCDQARSVRSHARDIQAETRTLAEATAATEERIAATLDQLARQQPHRAGQLQDMGESARRYAARERQRLLRQPGDGTSRQGHDHAPAASRPVPEPGRMPEPAASTTAPDHANDLSIIEERDRIATQVQDTIIRRVFAAGLSLESAAGLTANPEVRSRIEAAVSELDQAIGEIRNAVFQDAQHPDSRRLSQDIMDLGGQPATTASVPISGPVGNARLPLILQIVLSLIGEHATFTSVDITADTSSYSLTIEVIPLAPGESAGERASWLSALQARTVQIGVGVAIQPMPGRIRFICELPVGLVR